MSLRVAHLTTVHPAHEPRILERECVSLQEAGYEVHLIVPHDKPEVYRGVQVHNLMPVRGRVQRFVIAQWALYRAARKLQADLYHYHDPELFLAALALKFQGKKVIVDVHENLPEQILFKNWVHPLIRSSVARLAGVIERSLYKRFDGIVVVVPDLLVKFPAEKTALVRNFPALDIADFAGAEAYQKRPNSLLYVGRVEEGRGALEMCELVAALPKELSVNLQLAGPMSTAEIEQTLKGHAAAKQITFLGWQSRSQVRQLLGQARVGLNLLRPLPNYLKALPTKAFEYMAAGLPVLSTDLPLLTPIIEKHKCGLIVPSQDTAATVKALEWLLTHPKEAEEMGRRGQEAVKSEYSWGAEFRTLRNLYEKILGAG